ncbi:MAG: preprotein translocase subunit SecA [Chloroflexi bacterium]|nr:MAG: preprotein translocase subunit SecA [Chloroflexota bacterium]
MLKWLGRLVDSNERELKRVQPLVARVNALEADFGRLSDAELRAKTDQFKARYRDGAKLDDLLPEAFAAVREAAKRTLGQRHFDVQLMGGVVLHQGKIAEMKTGEGKTLVATLPLYLNSLTGEGCHLVTVNDYLSKRDPNWMGPVYHALGVSVASIQHEASFLFDPGYESDDPRWPSMRPVSRRQAYEADITYGTNNEFGFDYLRDNMVVDLSQCVQRSLHYAIVDEVDYILIDEARTPLIISGAAEEATQRYYTFARLVQRLVAEEDYTIDAKARAVMLTDEGVAKMEKLLRKEGLLKAPDLYDPSNYVLTHHLDNALKAHALYRRDRDYVVKDGQVIIVDEFTGRLMFGRRYSEGLHQAIEAKERVKIQRESVTLASITFQNYFRLYQKLAGMTGTAVTEAEEFNKIYKLEVVVIPTNRETIRVDHSDYVYKNEEAKFKAVANEIEALHAEGRPVLVGTTSIEKSERLSDLLRRRGVPHQVLNAKNHEKEAQIIAQAGRVGAVTVATNMAGRGVDIILGGSPEGRSREEWLAEHEKAVQLGGLHVIGTERHEARRIDNQLRGRAGRQGDPGSSRFYVSLEDDVVHRFGGDRVKGFMEWAGVGEDVPIEHSLVSKAIENAQVRVEGYHFEIRKHLVDYDDVVNRHREVIYGERKRILSGADLKANIESMIRDELKEVVAAHVDSDQVDLEGLLEDVGRILPLPPELNRDSLAGKDPVEIEGMLADYASSVYQQKEAQLGPDKMRVLERLVMLRTLDRLWMEHLTMMEHMRQGIGLQAVGHSDPLVAYKKEGHALFESLLANIRHDVVSTFYHVDIVKKEAAPSGARGQPQPVAARPQAPLANKKVGRNDPCPCGSGKKYKRCCGAGQ